jgi:hypothetical protein
MFLKGDITLMTKKEGSKQRENEGHIVNVNNHFYVSIQFGDFLHLLALLVGLYMIKREKQKRSGDRTACLEQDKKKNGCTY